MLTLALHELATNATKYGALSDSGGRLAIRWSPADGREVVQIQWVESGVHMPDGGQEPKRGFGRELIEHALPYDLGAKTSFKLGEDGVRCEIRMPVQEEPRTP